MTVDYTQTQYYGLDKYGDKSPADLRDGHNHNMDIIDKALKAHSTSIEKLDDFTVDVFPSVVELRKSKKVKDGDVVSVDGYLTAGDGGRAAWSVYSADTPKTRFDVRLDTGLYAHMVSKMVAPEALGSVSDWTDILNFMLSPESSVSNIVLSARTYPCMGAVTQRKTIEVQGNGASLDFGEVGGGLVVSVPGDDPHSRLIGTWEDVRLTGTPNVLIDIRSGIRGYFHNIKIEGFDHTGIRNAGGYENVFDMIQFIGKPSLFSVGIDDVSGDSYYSKVISRDVHTLFLIETEHTTINYVHAWILTPSIISGSTVFRIDDNSGNILINDVYDDTMETTFDISGNVGLTVNHIFDYINPNIWKKDDTSLPQRKFGVQWRNANPKTAGLTVRDWSIFHWKTVPFVTMNVAPEDFSGYISASRIYGGFDITKYSSNRVRLGLPDNMQVETGAAHLKENAVSISTIIRMTGIDPTTDLKLTFGTGELLGNGGTSTICEIVDNPYTPTTELPVYVHNSADLNDITVRLPKGEPVTGFLVLKVEIPIYRKQD